MLSSAETPRPLPPAKARRVTALLRKQELQSNSTPPPAYGSTFAVPTVRRHVAPTILGSPMANTFHMVGWDTMHHETDHDLDSNQLPSPPPEGEDPDWMTEKSKEELKDLLSKADGIIKERENDLGITSAVARGLYANNVTLQSRHQALLSRLPISPTPSSSSPDSLYRAESHSNNYSMVSSTSDSALGLIKSPKEPFYRGNSRRKIFIANSDISMLADQNAELLDKLEQLEAEATSADHAGRRELKRLEKEITFLREALEKTQAKSEELEEKVQEAVVGDVWRRKKEREAKFKAMRHLGRERDDEVTEPKIRDFAPSGSKFGGPSDAYSLFPADNSSASEPTPESVDGISNNLDASASEPAVQHEHTLIAQLLLKVQELEQTNARILQQQAETADQLSAVQRDTAQIAKVYETLADPDNSLQMETTTDLDDDENSSFSPKKSPTASQTIKFGNLNIDDDNETAFDGTFVVHPEFPTTAGKSRKSVKGLFDQQPPEAILPLNNNPPFFSPNQTTGVFPAQPQPKLDLNMTSSWSSFGSSAGLAGMVSPQRALSPLHFFSPNSEMLPELSPLSSRPTLQSELNKLGDDWGMELISTNEGRNNGESSRSGYGHLRTTSLYDLSQLSQFSVPPTPTPLSRAGTRLLADEVGEQMPSSWAAASNMAQEIPSSKQPLLMASNTLKLSIEPPTPDKSRIFPRSEGHSVAGSSSSYDDLLNTRSPRIKMMSDTLRSRSNRWVERRNLARSTPDRRMEDDLKKQEDYHGEYQEDGGVQKSPAATAAAAAATLIEIPIRLSNAIDNLIEDFQGFSVLDELAKNKESRAAASVGSMKGKRRPSDIFSAPNDSPAPSTRSLPRLLAARGDISCSSTLSSPSPQDEQYFDATDPDTDQDLSFDEVNNLSMVSANSTATTPSKKQQHGTAQGGILLQVWLWLQFAIVILVFVYAMAKKGPAVALGAGEQGQGRNRAVAKRR